MMHFDYPMECDFFSIYQTGRTKTIVFHGFTEESSSRDFQSDDNPYGFYWAYTRVSKFVMPLSEFVHGMQGDEEFYDNILQGCDEYQDDLTAEEMTEEMNHCKFFDGQAPERFVRMDQIKMSLPVGNYITKPWDPNYHLKEKR